MMASYVKQTLLGLVSVMSLFLAGSVSAQGPLEPIASGEPLYYFSERGYFDADGSPRLRRYLGYKVYSTAAGRRYEVIGTFYPAPVNKEAVVIRTWSGDGGEPELLDLCCGVNASAAPTDIHIHGPDVMVIERGSGTPNEFYRETRQALDNGLLTQIHRLRPQDTRLAILAYAVSSDTGMAQAELAAKICAAREKLERSKGESDISAVVLPENMDWLRNCP